MSKTFLKVLCQCFVYVFVYVSTLYPFDSENYQLRDDLRRSRRRIVHLQHQLRLSARIYDLQSCSLGSSIQIQDSGSCLRLSWSPSAAADIFLIISLQYYSPYHGIMSPAQDHPFPCYRPSPGSADSGISHRRRRSVHRLPWLSPSLS